MNHSMTQQEKQAAYDAWFITEVDKGLADLDAGRVVTDSAAIADMESFFAALEKESSKAA
jgi:predicted transcriptional regulator